MTITEYETLLKKMTPAEFARFKQKFGGDGMTPDWYVTNLLNNPQHEAKLCHILNMPTELERNNEAFRKSNMGTIIQNINGAQVIAGHSIHGNVTVIQVTFAEVLQAVEKQIQENQKIPPDEKKSLLAKLQDLAMNSYIANLATSAIWDGTKLLWTLVQ